MKDNITWILVGISVFCSLCSGIEFHLQHNELLNTQDSCRIYRKQIDSMKVIIKNNDTSYLLINKLIYK